ncbi:hypothetical protein FG386_000126 [Cryptosporidium ryanae]|uniref:uncharacterized protein n=1 Tax=Cryptosporidium ryanae TaxID=515981 RepID=UPI00351AA76F|nr:hypothetical protein FG386_000126 [Cryptosporidium ryanae]
MKSTTSSMLRYKIGNYRIGQTLGIGSFGKVKLGTHEPTGREVAVKIMNKEKMKSLNMYDKSEKEISILKSIIHPHIIRLYEVIDTPTDIYMIMEYVKGGELFDYILQKGRLSDDESRRLFQQLISGMEYCYLNGICHRDLKPENILLDDQFNIKIGDFGLSSYIKEGDFLITSCGSPNYAAPEVVSGKAYSGPEIDIWSCGVILYVLLCGALPFDDENVTYLFNKIRHGIFTIPGYVSDLGRSLILKMLTVDPSLRITYKEIRYHLWFRHNLPFYLEPQYYYLLRDDESQKTCFNGNFNGKSMTKNKGICILSEDLTQECALLAQKKRRHLRQHSVFSRQMQKKISLLNQNFSNACNRDAFVRSFQTNSDIYRFYEKFNTSDLSNRQIYNHHNTKSTDQTNLLGSAKKGNENSFKQRSILKLLYHKISTAIDVEESNKTSFFRGNPNVCEKIGLTFNYALDGKCGKSKTSDDCEKSCNSNGSGSLRYNSTKPFLTEGETKVGVYSTRKNEHRDLNSTTADTSQTTDCTGGKKETNESYSRDHDHISESGINSTSSGYNYSYTGNIGIEISSIPVSLDVNNKATKSRWLLGFEIYGDLTRIIKIMLNTLLRMNYEWVFISSNKLRCRPKRELFAKHNANDDNTTSINNLNTSVVSTSKLPHTESCPDCLGRKEDDFVENSRSEREIRVESRDCVNLMHGEKDIGTAKRSRESSYYITIQLFRINPFKYLFDTQIFDGPLLTNLYNAFKVTSSIYYNIYLNNLTPETAKRR